MSDQKNNQKDAASTSELPSMDEVFLDRLKKAIEDHLENKDFGVDELSREVGMSRSQIHRRLKDTVGQSASRFIRSYKLEKAKALLEKKVGRVAEVSDQLGFSSPVYFCQVFTEEFGYPPSAVEERKEASSEPQPPVGVRHWKVFLLVTGLVFIVGGVFWFQNSPFSYPPREPLDKSIAVLPFQNLSADPDNEYFSDGITEDIIGQLAKVNDLKVISRTSAMHYKNTDKSLTQIAEELGVTTILEGSVRKLEDQVRITAQLINATTDIHIWSETYDRQLDEIFSIQEEIAEEIAQSLEIKLTTRTKNQLNLRPTSDLKAYDYYLKGREYFQQKTRAAIENAIQLHRLAIEKDPDFALSYVGLIESYLTAIATHGYPSYWRDSAVAFAEKAYSLDDQSAEVYYALGRVNWNNERIQYYQKALELNPNFDLVYYYISLHHYYNKDLLLAIQSIQKALVLNPLFPRYLALYAGLLYLLEMDQEAIEIAKQGLILNPDFIELHAILSLIYRTLGDDENAIKHAETMLQMDPASLKGFNLLGDACMFRGDFESAKMYYEKARELNASKYSGAEAYRNNLLSLGLCMVKSNDKKGLDMLRSELETLEKRAKEEELSTFYIPFEIAAIYSILGDSEKAIDWVKTTLQTDFRIHRGFYNDPFFENVKNDPEFVSAIHLTKQKISFVKNQLQ